LDYPYQDGNWRDKNIFSDDQKVNKLPSSARNKIEIKTTRLTSRWR
jgi:hypothetical protein